MTTWVLKQTINLILATAVATALLLAGAATCAEAFAEAAHTGNDANHGQAVILDPGSGEIVTCAGQSVEAEDVFDPVTAAAVEDLVAQEAQNQPEEPSEEQSEEQLARQLAEDSRYVVSRTGGGNLKIAFPFAYKRLQVFTGEGSLTDSFGAESVSYYDPAGAYILEYSSDSAAAQAYAQLAGQFGREQVMPDLPIQGAGTGGSPYTSPEALSYSWGADMMGLDLARDAADRDGEITNTVKVAVLDSGICMEHELFRSRLAEGAASFIEGSPCSSDGSGHGTHVAGIIADGTSHQIQILPVKVLDGEGHGGFAEVINGIYYAAEQKVQVLNMSLAINLNDYGNYWSDTAVLQEERALEQAEAQGAICVAAAGNDSMNLDTLKVFPAISEHTLTISSITAGRERASSSNYGESVDYAAPGDQIRSANAENPQGYCVKSGTSMAAPHFTAACAMLCLYNPGIGKSRLVKLLDTLAVDLGPEGKDKKFGNGLIVFEEGRVPNADEVLGPEPPDPPPPEPPEEPERISLSSASVTMTSALTYTGKAHKPKPVVRVQGRTLQAGTDYTLAWSSNTGVGTGKVTVTGRGRYTGKRIRSFTIRPKGTSMKKCKGIRRGVQVTWKRQTAPMKRARITGYQIQRSTSPAFRKAVKTITVKGYRASSRKLTGLKKGKKYYLRIRTYMKTGGRTYYSAWSRTKAVRAK